MTKSNYLDFYNLCEDPFRLTPDPAFFYPSGEHVNALLSLDYIMKNREGFCLLTGEPGTGKSTLVRFFLNTWQDQAEIALVMTPRLSPEDFLQAILEDLEVPYSGTTNKNSMLKAFRDFLMLHAATGRRVAILVDEAQDLPIETLEELRLLSNLETDKEKLLQIILVGQTELADKLANEQLKQLNQRISIRAALLPLTAESTAGYLSVRLRQAGGQGKPLFDKSAVEALHSSSGGIPRLVNLIASRSLMAGYLEKETAIGKKQVEIAAKEVLRQEHGGKNKKSGTGRVVLIATAIAATLLTATLAAWIFSKPGNFISIINSCK